MLGKLIDGRLQIAGRIVKEGNTTITNPTEEKLKELGYKEIEYIEKPTYDKEEEKLYEVYTETTDKIIINYETRILTDEEHNKIIEQKIQQELSKVSIEDLINLYDGKKDTTNKINEIKNNVAELRAKTREIKNEK